jgi:predicted phage tail protein
LPDGSTIGEIIPPPRWHQPSGSVKNKFILHGRLRKRFGKEFDLGASTGARGIQMLCTLIPDFREELQKGEYRIVIGPMKKGHQLDVRGLGFVIPEGRPFHIIPVGKGRKSGTGAGKIIIGVLLVVAAFVLPIASPALFGSLAATAGVGGSIATAGTILGAQVLSGLALFGGAMIIGGISALLSSQPQNNQARDTQSFLLGGQLNVAQEGTPVPVIYGRCMVGSVVASMPTRQRSALTQRTRPVSSAPTAMPGFPARYSIPTTCRRSQARHPAQRSPASAPVVVARRAAAAAGSNHPTRCARWRRSGSSTSSAKDRSRASPRARSPSSSTTPR